MPKRTLLFTSLLLFAVVAVAQVAVLPVPTDLKAELAPTMGPMPAVLLTWKADDGPWGFTVYRSEADTNHFVRLGAVRMKSFIDPRVTNGTLYYYRVRSATMAADSQFVESAPSEIVRFTLSPIPPRPKGEIVGKVVDDATGNPIFGAPIRFFYRGPSIAIYPPPSAFTDTAGIYRAVLDTGSYYVRAESPMFRNCNCLGYVPEWYDNVLDLRLATPVGVIPDGSVRANFGLARIEPPKLVTIEGTVTNDVGMLTVVPVPLAGATVVLMRPIVTASNYEDAGMEIRATVDGLGFCPGIVWKARTDSLGHYTATVPVGTYIAVASLKGYLPEYYKEKTNPLQADRIEAKENVTGVDFTLSPNPVWQNSIAGMVRDSAGTGVPSRIILFPLSRRSPSWTMIAPAIRVGHTDSTGAYLIEKVPTGKYFVLAVPFNRYFPSFYKEGMYGVWNWQKADTVFVEGNVTGIDIGVVKVVRCGVALLTGRLVRHNGDPIDGARILVRSAAGDLLGFGVSDVTGNYAVENLPQVPMVLSFDMEGYLPGEKTMNPAPDEVAFSAGDFALDEIVTDVHVTPFVPESFGLHPNYPNPFNPSTTITYDMSTAGVAKLVVYNILGQEMATLLDASVQPGRRTVVWNGMDRNGKPAGSGIYLLRFTVSSQSGGAGFVQTRKMMLVR